MNAVQYSRSINKVVNFINIDSEGYFDQEVIFSEDGLFSYEGRIKGRATEEERGTQGVHPDDLKWFELEIDCAFQKEEVLDLTQYELTLIEDIIKEELRLNFNN